MPSILKRCLLFWIGFCYWMKPYTMSRNVGNGTTQPCVTTSPEIVSCVIAMDTWCNSRTARNRVRTSNFPTWFLGPFSTRPLELERSLGTRLPAGFQLEPCHRLLAVWKRQTVIKTRAMPVSLRSRAQVPATPAGDFASKLNWIKVTLRARSMDCIFQWEYMK